MWAGLDEVAVAVRFLFGFSAFRGDKVWSRRVVRRTTGLCFNCAVLRWRERLGKGWWPAFDTENLVFCYRYRELDFWSVLRENVWETSPFDIEPTPRIQYVVSGIVLTKCMLEYREVGVWGFVQLRRTAYWNCNRNFEIMISVNEYRHSVYLKLLSQKARMTMHRSIKASS